MFWVDFSFGLFPLGFILRAMLEGVENVGSHDPKNCVINSPWKKTSETCQKTSKCKFEHDKTMTITMSQ